MNNIDIAVKETLGKADLPSLLEQIGEFSVDQILEEGALRDLPIIGSVLGVIKIGVAVRDLRLVRKLLRFLSDLSSLPTNVRTEMVDRLEADPSFGRPVGQKIVGLLDRIDDEEKAMFAARAFKAYAAGQISGRELRRLLYAVERLLLSDICVLDVYVQGDEENYPESRDPRIQSFVSGGLLYVRSGFGVGGVWPTDSLGLFARHVLLKNRQGSLGHLA